ncbi:putative bifunctional diguanylate cyclase/phosphodiesterase [Massilia phyllosphaerae]|uniref:putative bifunctional diguanylate cyclase/phosphodiesterase n=1 Tax=Massilia phyllosphaerae TaxID=3106034 RepID=UPI002B1CAD3F|nr:EAL domain-containing protein [Massilia sp. SGZ-792]
MSRQPTSFDSLPIVHDASLPGIAETVDRSQQRMNAMLESIGDAFFAVDRHWRVIYANRKAAAFVGIELGAGLGRQLLDLAPMLEGTALLDHYRSAMASGCPGVLETLWAPTGAWVEVRTYPTDDGLSVYFHDISEQRRAADALRRSEQRFRSLFEQAGDSILITDRDLCVVAANASACATFGYSEAEFIGSSVHLVDSGFPYDQALLDSLRKGHTHLLRITKRRRDGSTFPAEVRVSRFEDGGQEFFQAIIRDLSEREEAERRLRHLATHDSLTGLPNRTLLHERLQAALDACTGEASVAVLFLDLDRFKEINDSFGHDLGDVLLCEVAQRLRRVLGPDDTLARLGGDEFVVVAPCDGGAAEAEGIAARLLALLGEAVPVGTQDVIIGASIGISLYPRDAATREVLFQTADTAMYRAKAAGRNRYRFFEAAMTARAQARMALETSLRPALARGEFELAFQPRIDLRSMAMVGMEALIRWNHPQLGRVAPGEFIAIAEETGLITEIGHWVLHEACRATQALVASHARPVRVSVNVSARQLAQAGFVGEVRGALEASGLAPCHLELELTESALIEDMDRTAAMLGELQALGVKIAVDDFGTGYSGLAYLRRFPIDVLKLDRSFVLQDDGRISAFDFVKAFVDMAHALRMSVVAEGVETAEVLDFLRAASCDEAQGYLLARPMPLPAVGALLGAH